MKIALLFNSDVLVLPVLNGLKSGDMLSGVAIPERSKAYLLPLLLQLGIKEEEIAYISLSVLEKDLTDWITKNKAEVVWVFGFPYKIPESVLRLPEKGFLNFHFGLLPKYAGADPIFWQIKNQEKTGGFVIHKMTKSVDRGPVIWRQEVPMIPGENYGIYCNRMGVIAAAGLNRFVEILNAGETKAEKEEIAGESPFFRKPAMKDLVINWQEQTSEDIESLVNACNPKYGGASTSLRNMEVRVLEVSPAEVNDASEFKAEPGTIVYADNIYGLIVACKEQKYLKVNVVHLNEGYLSGSKLFSMGVKVGEKFITKN